MKVYKLLIWLIQTTFFDLLPQEIGKKDCPQVFGTQASLLIFLFFNHPQLPLYRHPRLTSFKSHF
jgi:hypothetical protein